MNVLKEPSTIHFSAKLITINSWTILLVPPEFSVKLPSRGMTMVKGRINGIQFQTELEPDGKGSHWFKVDESLLKSIGVHSGDTVLLEIESTNEWPEPKVPEDVKVALDASLKAQTLWTKITPMARWDWLRWIGSTKNPETRTRRIEVTCSKLSKGMRRPCCFNRSLCCDPSVSNNGVLLEPTVYPLTHS